MAIVCLGTSAGFTAPGIDNNHHIHVCCGQVYGHECGRYRTTVYSAWINNGYANYFGVCEERYYVRTRSVSCAICGRAFTSTLEYKTERTWLWD